MTVGFPMNSEATTTDPLWPAAAGQQADLSGCCRGNAAVASAKISGSNLSIAPPTGFPLRFGIAAIGYNAACPNGSPVRSTCRDAINPGPTNGFCAPVV